MTVPFDPMLFLDKYGVTIAVLAYFIWKDYRFTGRIGRFMARIDEHLGLKNAAAPENLEEKG